MRMKTIMLGIEKGYNVPILKPTTSSLEALLRAVAKSIIVKK